MFSAYFTGILRVRRARKILDVFEGFPWFLPKRTKEKKDRALLRKGLHVHPEKWGGIGGFLQLRGAIVGNSKKEKKLVSVKYFVRNSGTGSSVFFGGGARGGWKCQFYFYGRGDFSGEAVNPHF